MKNHRLYLPFDNQIFSHTHTRILWRKSFYWSFVFFSSFRSLREVDVQSIGNGPVDDKNKFYTVFFSILNNREGIRKRFSYNYEPKHNLKKRGSDFRKQVRKSRLRKSLRFGDTATWALKFWLPLLLQSFSTTMICKNFQNLRKIVASLIIRKKISISSLKVNLSIQSIGEIIRETYWLPSASEDRFATRDRRICNYQFLIKNYS